VTWASSDVRIRSKGVKFGETCIQCKIVDDDDDDVVLLLLLLLLLFIFENYEDKMICII
jgi:hypothetical protein